MQTWTARVRNGRLVMDEETDLPEGTELELTRVDALDQMGEDEQPREEVEAAWRAEIRRRVERYRAGEAKTVPWEEVRERLFDG